MSESKTPPNTKIPIAIVTKNPLRGMLFVLSSVSLRLSNQCRHFDNRQEQGNNDSTDDDPQKTDNQRLNHACQACDSGIDLIIIEIGNLRKHFFHDEQVDAAVT